MNDILSLLTQKPPVPKGIPEDQLARWSEQGATVSAQKTHEKIRGVIDVVQWNGSKPNVYLQGSYRNSTNIRGDSDVDIVVEWNLAKPLLLYTHADEVSWFKEKRATLIRALDRAFDVAKPADKCIKLPRTQTTIPADVVPAFTHFKSSGPLSLMPPGTGMKFFVEKDQRWVINFPKQHYDHGAAKNARTRELYKPTVRMFKNALAWAGYDFPGYFVECLLFNVPDEIFLAGQPPLRSLFLGTATAETRLRVRYQAIINWLGSAQLTWFRTQNGEGYLFGDTPEQWNENTAKQVIMVWTAIWNHYS